MVSMEIHEQHNIGHLSIENEELVKSILKEAGSVDVGLQVACDGRIWLCVASEAFIRFKPDKPKLVIKEAGQAGQDAEIKRIIDARNADMFEARTVVNRLRDEKLRLEDDVKRCLKRHNELFEQVGQVAKERDSARAINIELQRKVDELDGKLRRVLNDILLASNNVGSVIATLNQAQEQSQKEGQ